MTSLVLIWCINSLKGETHTETHMFLTTNVVDSLVKNNLNRKHFAVECPFVWLVGYCFFCNK
jgi:hypothetical protein